MLTEKETASILRLPEAARKKALRLQASADAMYSAARERSHRSNEIRKEVYDHEGWLSKAIRDRSYSEDDVAIAGTRAKVDILKSELAEIDAARGDTEIRRNSAGRLAARIRDVIALPTGQTFRLSDRQPATLRKGEDVPTAVRRCREKIAELRAKAIEIEAAPFPSSLAKEQAAAQIASLAEAGKPDVSQAILNDGMIEFAKTMDFVKGERTAGYVETPNAMATLCWMFRDKLIEAVHAEIDRNAEDENALHPDERKSQLSKIASQIEALEYDEVGHIEAAARDGLTIDHRPDISIYALLWLDPRPVAVPQKPAAPYVSRANRQPGTPAPVHAASSMPEPAHRGSI